MTAQPRVATTDPARPGRVAWIDAGRGVAILLVVLYHAARWLGSEPWEAVNAFVATLRMPFFFVLSGLLATRVASMAWRELWRRRLSLYLWVFAVWEAVGVLAYLAGFALQGTRLGIRGLALDLLLAPVRPLYELWFVWALAVLCVLARLTRHVDLRVRLAVTGAAALVALTDGFDAGNLGWNGVLRYAFFFLCGMYGRELVLRLAAVRAPFRLGLLGGWAVLAVLEESLGWATVPGVHLVVCCAGVAAGVSLAVLVARWGGLRSLGAATLPVYLGHTPVIIFAASAAVGVLGSRVTGGWAVVACPALAALAVVASRAVHRWVDGGPLAWLYAAPGWFAGTARRPSVPQPAPGGQPSVVGRQSTEDDARP
ncbi:acyltransferase family protein [Xylanimonas oleitrophica]|uniref:acyltransferase family protein n=1 Tax=Xylanimonas oleitrophica TaxID=2607479 RepID=UPI0015D042EB|nr:acyltransferase [Xylanimonas oleitrophica]